MKKPNLNLKRASLLTSSLLCSALLIAVPLRKELNEGWKFKQARLSNWYPATVPGVVHTDLMDNKIIEDPFFRLNERGMQWIDKEDWIYQTTFQLTPEMMGRENIDLIFKGLDTYADVYLNEKKILEANNMFREWKTSIKPDLKPGENVLKIYFHSPIKVDIPKWDALPYQYEAGNDQSENGGVFNKKVSVFARKAGYHYGWDWGPRLVTSGIWRPVYVEAWDNARINDVFIRQPEVSKSRASLIGEVEILADKEIDQANVTITEAASGRVLAGQTVSLQKGINKISLPFSIKSPKLWWSNGLGEPHLYSFRTDLTVNNQTSDAWTEEVGLRSLKIINRPDKDGKTFYVELNGIPVFAKGANYIPQDNFLPRVTPEQYEKTILDAANANMNMLRIWGGGTYESDLFYQLCDRYGILVWQDMPNGGPSPEWQNNRYFDGTEAKRTAESEAQFRKEWKEIVDQLYNHPSVAMWVPFNEAWGQFRTEEIARWTKDYDPTRIVNAASGGNFYPDAGEVLDIHSYPHPRFFLFDIGRVNVIGEYGGIGLPLEGHLWQPDQNWGYVRFKNAGEVTDEYVRYAEMLERLIPTGCSGAVYTQTTDVEIEVNGLMTYDRKRMKVDERRLHEVNQRLCRSLGQ